MLAPLSPYHIATDTTIGLRLFRAYGAHDALEATRGKMASAQTFHSSWPRGAEGYRVCAERRHCEGRLQNLSGDRETSRKPLLLRVEPRFIEGALGTSWHGVQGGAARERREILGWGTMANRGGMEERRWMWDVGQGGANRPDG